MSNKIPEENPLFPGRIPEKYEKKLMKVERNLQKQQKEETESKISALSSKKIILTGPPAVGKTTLKLAFFEKANPLSLLDSNNPVLEPTRGAEVNNYRLFDSELGVFDLAGQENENWFGSESVIFSNTDVLINVFDVKTPLGQISSFIEDIARIHKDFCPDSYLYVIFHKIDLISNYDLFKKTNYLLKYMKMKHPEIQRFKILNTSIEKDYFFDSYLKIQSILLDTFQKGIIKVSKNDYQILNLCFKFVLNYEYDVSYYVSDISSKLSINPDKISDFITKLKYLDLVKIEENDSPFGNSFRLTERSYFIKSNINRIQSDTKKEKLTPIEEFRKMSRQSDFTKAKEIEDPVSLDTDSPELLFHVLSKLQKERQK